MIPLCNVRILSVIIAVTDVLLAGYYRTRVLTEKINWEMF